MKKLRILTLIFHVFILIPGGFEALPLGFLEIGSLARLFSGNLQINVLGPYDERIETVGLLSFVGQITLISSIYFGSKTKSRLTITGCAILVVSTCILTQDAFKRDVFGMHISDVFSLVTALPFIVTALVLATKEIKGLRQLIRLTDRGPAGNSAQSRQADRGSIS